jgi:hypothetical protein
MKKEDERPPLGACVVILWQEKLIPSRDIANDAPIQGHDLRPRMFRRSLPR